MIKTNGRIEGEILITYGAHKNNRGWTPWVADDNGNCSIVGAPLDFEEEARAVAKVEADLLADKYVGDWDCRVVLSGETL